MLKLVNKISSLSMIGLLIGIILEMFHPAFVVLTILSCCGLYTTILIKNTITHDKLDIILLVLCSLSLGWMILREFIDSPYMVVSGLLIMYLFLLRSFKISTNQWNHTILIFGSLTILFSVINIYLKIKLLSYVIIALQFYIIFKIIDPILEKIALEHRRKRLAAEAEHN